MPNIGRIVPLKSSLNTPADDVDASVTKSNTCRMNGSWNADSRNGANEMRIGGQPQDCVGDGLDSSVGHCRANELEISAMHLADISHVPSGGEADISRTPQFGQGGQQQGGQNKPGQQGGQQ